LSKRRASIASSAAGYVHTLPALRDRRVDLGVLVADLLFALAPDYRRSKTHRRAR
jgi:hypothetical protein